MSSSKWRRSLSHDKCSRRFCGSSRNCGRSHHQRHHEAFDCHASKSNRQEECVQMPVKIAGSDCSTIVRAARAAGSHPHLSSVLQWHLDAFLLGRNSANICVGLGVIRGILVETRGAHHSMRVLIGRRFTEGFLDYHRGPSDYLVETVVWKNLERLQGLYYERPKSLWMIWNYLWDIGALQTIRKVLSRNQERYRNEKYVACGIGYVRERPDGSLPRDGALVLFLAPCYPRAAERIALPVELLKTVNPDGLS